MEKKWTDKKKRSPSLEWLVRAVQVIPPKQCRVAFKSHSHQGKFPTAISIIAGPNIAGNS